MGAESTVVLRAMLRDELTAALKSIQGDLQNVGEKGDEAGKSVTRSWTDMKSAFDASAMVLGKVASGIMSVVQATSEYDALRARLKATEGSALVGEADLKMIQELSKIQGMGFSQAASAFAALRSMRVDAKESVDILKGLAEANASMGGGAEAFGRVMYQVQQSIGVGKLMGEDLRAIKEAIPNLGQLMQDAYGTADAEAINKRLQETGKSVKDFWSEVASMAHGLPPAGETIANNLDNIGDAWKRVKANLGDTLPIKQATSAIGSLLEKLSSFQETSLADAKLTARARSNLGMTGGSAPKRLFDMVFHGDELYAEKLKIGAQDAAKEYAETSAKAESDKTKAAENAAKAEAEKRREQAKKASEALAKEIARTEAEARKYVIGSGSDVTLREGVGFGEAAYRNAAAQDRENAEKADKRSMEARARDRERLQKEILQIDKQIADQEIRVEKAKTRAIEEETRRRIEVNRWWTDALEGGIEKQVLLLEKGDFTIKGLAQSLKSFAMESVARLVAQTAVSVIQAKALDVAWREPAMLASIASFGAADIAGITGFEAAMAASTIGAHARGGFSVGKTWAHEVGPEAINPVVPVQFTPASQTTNNYGGNSVTINIHGGDKNSIVRTLQNALANGQKGSR